MINFPQKTNGLSSLYIHIAMDVYAELSTFLAYELASSINSYNPFTGEIITSTVNRKLIHDRVKRKYGINSVEDLLDLAITHYAKNSRIIHAIVFAVADQYSCIPFAISRSNKMREFIRVLTVNHWDYYTVAAFCRIARANNNINRVYQEVAQHNCSNYNGIFLLLTEFTDDETFCSAFSVFYQYIIDCCNRADREYTLGNYAMLEWFVKRCAAVDLSNEELCISVQAKKTIGHISDLVNDVCTGVKERRLIRYGFSKYAIVYLNYKLHNKLSDKKEEEIETEYLRQCIMYSTEPEQIKEFIAKMHFTLIDFNNLNCTVIDFFKNYPAIYNTFREMYSSFSLASFRFLCFSMTPNRKKWVDILSEDDFLVNLNWNIEQKIPNIDLSGVPALLESGYMSLNSFSRLVADGIIDPFSCNMENEYVRELLSGFIASFNSKECYNLLFNIYDRYGIHFISRSMQDVLSRCIYCVSSYLVNIKVKIPFITEVTADYDRRLLNIIMEFAAVNYMQNFNDAVHQILDCINDEDQARMRNLQQYLYEAIKSSSASDNFKACLINTYEEEYYE